MPLDHPAYNISKYIFIQNLTNTLEYLLLVSHNILPAYDLSEQKIRCLRRQNYGHVFFPWLLWKFFIYFYFIVVTISFQIQ